MLLYNAFIGKYEIIVLLYRRKKIQYQAWSFTNIIGGNGKFIIRPMEMRKNTICLVLFMQT